MESEERVLGLLNEALSDELIAINQYWLHYRLLAHWGIRQLASLERGKSVQEMKHADRLMQRILFLAGQPRIRRKSALRQGSGIEAILRADLELELTGVAQLADAIQHCEEQRDYVSRKLLSDMLQDKQEQIDTGEQQLELIGRVGAERYAQLQSHQDQR